MKKFYILSETKLEQIIQDRIAEAASSATQSYERELLMKQANISMLQGQINPHFLYNALECIRGQALLEGSEDIARAAQALSLFFRYSISGSSDFVTLKEELQNVENYMTIQQYRFKNRFTLNIKNEASKETSEALVPKLTLQPIVENSIIHGFSNQKKDAVITIRIFRLEHHLHIIVSDNGDGMDIATLDRLNKNIACQEAPEQAANAKHSGIALRNVDRRIKLFFGTEYGLSIYSCIGMGTDVEIIFPLQFSLSR